MIAVNIRGHDATSENIIESKEFGVNIAAEDQNVLCSVAGKYTGRHVDKIKSRFLRRQVLQYFIMPSISSTNGTRSCDEC